MSSSTAQTLILLAIVILCAMVSAKAIRNTFETVTASPPSAITVARSMGGDLPPLDKVLAPAAPTQTLVAHPEVYRVKEFELTELAKFDASVFVLSTLDYPLSVKDKEAQRSMLSPMDIAVGWGPMSNPSVLNNFRYFQRGRFFNFANFVSYTPTAATLETDSHVANIHIIPASKAVAAALSNIHPNMKVRLVGSLVEIRQTKGSYKSPVVWRSSLTRNDMGEGACELLYLKRLEWTQIEHEGYALAPLPQIPADAVSPDGL